MALEKETGGAATSSAEKIWVTLNGLPLTIKLAWPFHQSTSGADFWVLHGDIRLEGAEGLHCPVAVNLSQTVREVLPSIEPKDAEAPVINALRKEVDRRQIEFLKSGKLLPVAFSSRHYDFKRQQWVSARPATTPSRSSWSEKFTGSPSLVARRKCGSAIRPRRNICRRPQIICCGWRHAQPPTACCGSMANSRKRLRDCTASQRDSKMPAAMRSRRWRKSTRLNEDRSSDTPPMSA